MEQRGEGGRVGGLVRGTLRAFVACPERMAVAQDLSYDPVMGADGIQREAWGEPEIRLASVADMQSIQHLHDLLCQNERECGFASDIPPAWSFTEEARMYLLGRIEGRDGIALVAESAGGVVAFLLGGTRPTASGTASALESVFVVEEFRQRGIGTALVRQFLHWHGQSGRAEASVAVAAANGGAIALYRKAGFVPSTLVLTFTSA